MSDAARAATRPRRRPIGVAIGASTGGPKALLTLLADLTLPPAGYAFLVQHIHPSFVPTLLRRLREAAALPVEEAVDGARAEPGRVYVAPGGHHLWVERDLHARFRTRLSDAPPVHGVRPSLDVLFASVATAFGPRALGVVLTGMGRDGVEGGQAIKARGGRVLVESPATCVVYGMPKGLVEAGLADGTAPITEMAGAIRAACDAVSHGPADAHAVVRR